MVEDAVWCDVGFRFFIQCLLPRNLTWNLKMVVSKRSILFWGRLFRFHAKFQGYNTQESLETWWICIPNLMVWKFGISCSVWLFEVYLKIQGCSPQIAVGPELSSRQRTRKSESDTDLVCWKAIQSNQPPFPIPRLEMLTWYLWYLDAKKTGSQYCPTVFLC